MNLEKKWDWEKRKLACRVRLETGNPGADELRERICDLLGMDYVSFQRHFLADKEKAVEKTSAVKEDKKDKDKGEPPAPRPASVQAALRRINTSLGLFSQSDAVRPTTTTGEDHGMPMHRRNIHKKFIEVPRSPPRRALYDLKMERLHMAIQSVSITGAGGEPGASALEGEIGPEDNSSGSHKPDPESSAKRKIRKLQAKLLSEPMMKAPLPDMADAAGRTDPRKLFKPYNGDIFGLEVSGKDSGGMIYLSRMAPRKGKKGAKARDEVVLETVADGQMAAPEGGAVPEVGGGSEEKLTIAPSLKEIQGKIHCAQTLCNWTQYDANTERLAKEGAVQAIMRLSKEADRTIRRCCATAFRNMSTRPLLARQLVQLSAVQVVAELSSSAGKAKQITVDCTVTLVNLTKNVGTEGKLVEDGIVLALMALPNDTEEWDELCARGLFNLTCVDSSYPFMERVIKAFMSLASSSFPTVKYICASALCNIADLKQMRMRMVEEGVIQVLGMLSRGADIKTRRLCAIIIHSLAANKSVRAEMASRGAIQVIYGLSADNDMTTLYCAASSILRLSVEEANAGRLISEGGISAISNVAIRCADVASTSQACAGTLHVLSTRPEQRSVIVQEGCIPALITMLRTSVDYLTLHYSVLAVCNLLTVEDNQVHILQQGGVQTIVQLCRHEHQGIQKSCAFAIFTLACVETARKQAAACGAIPVIISLARVQDEQLQMFCAATLCMMSCDQDHIPPMVKEGVIHTFIDLLQSSNSSTIRYSCAALCCLAYNSSSCMHVLEQGAVPHVVHGALNGDASTKQSCCAVISALSTHPECRQQLCDMEVLPALVSLSSMDDEMTRLRCAVAFANLSYETTAQELMVRHGVVPILSELSISYSEENQVYCAKALCNLACHIGSEKAIVEQGGMAALMMIGMVRTVNQQTKQICAKAILNLLAPQTVERVVEDGLVTACSSLCKMDDEPTMKACAYIFCLMSLEHGPRQKLASKVSGLHGLFRLMRSSDPTTKAIVGRAVCNLLAFEDSRATAVAEGGVEVLKEIALSGETEPEIYSAETFFRICHEQPCRLKLIEARTLPVIILLARSPHQATRRICVRMLCVLAWHLDSRAELLKANGVAALVAILERISSEGGLEERQAITEMCTRAFFYMSLNAEHHEALVRDAVVPALLSVQRAGHCNAAGDEFALLTLRNLTDSQGIRRQLVQQGGLPLLCSTAKRLSGSDAMMQACAVSLYNLSLERELRTELIGEQVLEVLLRLSHQRSCRAVVSALMYIMSLESANRLTMVTSGMPEVLHSFLEQPGDDEPLVMTQNCCATVLMLSRSPECRVRMQQASLVPIIIKLSKSKNPKICDSASQALNCLSENSTEGIKEGTVAALIAIALDGNAASKADISAEDYLQVPEIPALDPLAYAPGPHLAELPGFKGLEVHPQKMPAGPAGKGPKPPKPPSILDDKKAIGIRGAGGAGGKAEDELMLDAEEEPSSVDKIMMFAKMDLPPKFLENEANARVEDDGAEDFKMTTDLEEPSKAARNSVDATNAVAGAAVPPAASKPAGGSSKALKPPSLGQASRQGTRKAQGSAASSISSGANNSNGSVGSNGSGSKGSGKKGAASGPSSVIKAVKKPPATAHTMYAAPAVEAPLLPGAMNTMELELKKPVPILHGPKDKIPNFFETAEFLKQVRQPHEWVREEDKPVSPTGNGSSIKPGTAAPVRLGSTGEASGGKTLGDRASELGLWS